MNIHTTEKPQYTKQSYTKPLVLELNSSQTQAKAIMNANEGFNMMGMERGPTS